MTHVIRCLDCSTRMESTNGLGWIASCAARHQRVSGHRLAVETHAG